jgi:hypothetical protein
MSLLLKQATRIREDLMKNTALRMMFIAAVCCLLAAGCKREAELYYDASEYAVEISGFGYTSGPYNVENLVVFDAATLSGYVGWKIVEMRLFNPEQNYPISYTPVVYEADPGAAAPASQAALNSSPAEITSLNWRTIDLETPVTIQASRDYWAGYRMVAEAGQYPLAVGAESDYGNSRTQGSAGYGAVAYNWIVRIVVRKR